MIVIVAVGFPIALILSWAFDLTPDGVTNREINDGKSGLKVFGNKPNEKGPNELRLVEVTAPRSGTRVRIVPDKLTAAEKKKLNMPVSQEAYASQLIARSIFDRVSRSKK